MNTEIPPSHANALWVSMAVMKDITLYLRSDLEVWTKPIRTTSVSRIKAVIPEILEIYQKMGSVVPVRGVLLMFWGINSVATAVLAHKTTNAKMAINVVVTLFFPDIFVNFTTAGDPKIIIRKIC